MSDTPGPAMLATMGAALLLLLVGVTVVGSRSLALRGQEARIRGWLVELWLFAVLFGALFVLSARGLGYDLLEALGRVREGTMSQGSLILAVAGGVLGLVCAFRMFALVREGVGQLYASEEDSDGAGRAATEDDDPGPQEPDEERDVK